MIYDGNIFYTNDLKKYLYFNYFIKCCCTFWGG